MLFWKTAGLFLQDRETKTKTWCSRPRPTPRCIVKPLIENKVTWLVLTNHSPISRSAQPSRLHLPRVTYHQHQRTNYSTEFHLYLSPRPITTFTRAAVVVAARLLWVGLTCQSLRGCLSRLTVLPRELSANKGVCTNRVSFWFYCRYCIEWCCDCGACATAVVCTFHGVENDKTKKAHYNHSVTVFAFEPTELGELFLCAKKDEVTVQVV